MSKTMQCNRVDNLAGPLSGSDVGAPLTSQVVCAASHRVGARERRSTWENRSRPAVFLLALLAPCIPALSQAPAQVGTVFEYQGQLKQDGVPIDGTCNFEFTLWNAESAGTQVGHALVFDGDAGNPAAVAVADGLFDVSLDFDDLAILVTTLGVPCP